MKKILFFGLLSLGAWWGYLHKTAVSDFVGTTIAAAKNSFFMPAEKPTEPAEVATVAPPAAEPKPVVEASMTPNPPPPATKAAELPPDVYYTIERVTYATEVGIKAIPAATQVQKVGQDKDGLYVVDDGKVRIPVRMYKLTREPAEVAALLQKAAADQPPPPQAASTPGAPPHPAGPGNTTSANQASNRAELDTKARMVRVQIDAVNRQINQKQSELAEVRNKDAYERSRGHASFYGASIARVQSDIATLENYRTHLTMQLAALGR